MQLAEGVIVINSNEEYIAQFSRKAQVAKLNNIIASYLSDKDVY